MEPFANLYWSADYKSGIDSLTSQSLRSLKQLHDARKLVFSYMNYYNSNSEYLTKFAIEMYPLDSSFRALDVETGPKTPKKNRQLSDHLHHVSIDSTLASIDLTYAYEQHVRGTSEEAQTLINLASVIERNILSQLTTFIKLHEPQVLKIISDLKNILEDYAQTYKKVEDLKSQYSNYLRLNEISKEPKKEVEPQPDVEDDEKDDATVEEVGNVNSTSSLIDSNEPTLPSASPELTMESEFDFPVKIGSITITEPRDFSKLLKGMRESISTVKRKIPLPGYKNQIFSSNQICEWLIRYRPFGLEPSRRNMERFGQSLIDLKLLVGTGFFAKKFNSENMWFEWSDMAVYIADYELNKAEEPASPRVLLLPKVSKLVDEQTTKFMNDTSKRFNGMINSMKTNFLRNDYSTLLEEVEDKYNEAYIDLQELRHLLEREMFVGCQSLEKFENSRIEIIYQTFTKLLEISYNFSLASTSRLHKQATAFITDINTPEIYRRDFNKMVEHYSTGIYFPTTIAPDVLTKQHFSTHQANNNFQNIKHQFNLYKDISLQLQHESNLLLSLTSIPEILLESIKLVEGKNSESDVQLAWTSPIDYQGYWKLKEDIIEEINTYEPSEAVDSTKESEIHREILHKVIALLGSKQLSDIVNFIKNWLLEISDSLIPCMIYDSLVNIYKAPTSDVKAARNELVKHLSSIPRSNLSSLVYLLEHLSVFFSLDVISTYQKSDELPNVLSNSNPDMLNSSNPEIVVNNSTLIKDVAASLNSMDQIGGIPFVHLISRPSAAKNAKGFKPPLTVYNSLLADLLNVEVRSALLENLITSERNYLTKKEKEKGNLGLLKSSLGHPKADTSVESVEKEQTTPVKKPTVAEPTHLAVVSGTIPKSPRPLSGDNFALRPFRTGTTPRPSPRSSPRHTPKNSVDGENEIKMKKLRDGNRNRSGSTGLLASSMSVEFEE